MKLHRCLDEVLSSAAKLKVLRELTLRPSARSGRALARDIHLSHAQVGIVLEELHQAGLVALLRVGRSHVYTLCRDTFVAREILIPLFEKERDLFDALTREIVSAIQTPMITVFISESAARQGEVPASGLDLAIVVRGRKEREAIEDELAGDVSELATRLGIRLGYHVFTQRDFRQRFLAKEKFLREIVNEARPVAGAYPMDVVKSAGSAKRAKVDRPRRGLQKKKPDTTQRSPGDR